MSKVAGESPDYYNMSGIEVRKFIDSLDLNWNRGCMIKYAARAGVKDPADEIKDLRKIARHVEMEIERIEMKNEGRRWEAVKSAFSEKSSTPYTEAEMRELENPPNMYIKVSNDKWDVSEIESQAIMESGLWINKVGSEDPTITFHPGYSPHIIELSEFNMDLIRGLLIRGFKFESPLAMNGNWFSVYYNREEA